MDRRKHSRMPNLVMYFYCLLTFLLISLGSQAQYRGDHIPGLLGLESGTQAPPALYIGDLVYVYPTSTIKTDKGNNIHLPGGLTSSADAILINLVTNYKIFGANVGGSIAFPFMKNRIEFNSASVSTSWAYTDMFGGLNLGWHLKRADVTAGYNLYIPTGKFAPNASDNTGLGMWANEFTLGSTVYLDQKRMWNAAANFSLEFNTDKRHSNIRVGDVGTLEGGLGRTFYKKMSGPIPIVMNLGAAGYAQFKVTGDSGSDIPTLLQGLKDHTFALGPEFNVFIPGPNLSLSARYEPEFGGRDRTQGQSFAFSIVWVAKSLVKHQP
jgi:hypothetical protein